MNFEVQTDCNPLKIFQDHLLISLKRSLYQSCIFQVSKPCQQQKPDPQDQSAKDIGKPVSAEINPRNGSEDQNQGKKGNAGRFYHPAEFTAMIYNQGNQPEENGIEQHMAAGKALVMGFFNHTDEIRTGPGTVDQHFKSPAYASGKHGRKDQ